MPVIDNKEISSRDVGRVVAYVPGHAVCEEGINTSRCEYGRITSYNSKYVFVNFGSGENGQSVSPGDLRFIHPSAAALAKEFDLVVGDVARWMCTKARLSCGFMTPAECFFSDDPEYVEPARQALRERSAARAKAVSGAKITAVQEPRDIVKQAMGDLQDSISILRQMEQISRRYAKIKGKKT